MSTHDDRRHGQGAGRPGPGQGERQAQQRRGPLFPLEADDITPRARRAPPAPLGELLGDLDDAMAPPVIGPRDDASPRRTPAPAAAVRPTSAAASREQGRPQEARATMARPTIMREAAARKAQELRPSLLEELLEDHIPAIDSARARYESAEAQLTRLQIAEARPRLGGYVAPAAPPALSLSRGVVLCVICVASLMVLLTLGGRDGSSLSAWRQLGQGGDTLGAASNTLVASLRGAGDYNLKGPPSVTPQQIDRILDAYGSPAVGTGELFYNLGLKYGIDPAFAVAFFIHESSAGTNPRWDGMKVFDGNDPRRSLTTHNIGNISCAGYPTCLGRWRDYPDWASGIEDWYKLIDVEYIQGRGHQTVADVIPVYAPSFENDVQRYIDAVNGLVDQWRSEGVR